MRIIDTYDQILRCFPTAAFSRAVWRDYANALSGELIGKAEEDARDYDFEREIAPVIRAALAKRADMERAHDSFLTATQNLSVKLRDTLATELDVDIVFYLGLCSGAGWATRLDGRAAVLLGLEKIVELDWCGLQAMRGLVYHELGHVWHHEVGKSLQPESQSGRALRQLLGEGIAMRCEQLLSDDDNFYHQNRDGWLAWCISHEETIKREYLRRIRAEESVQDFFGDWERFEGRSDVGYFLGCTFVRFLEREYALVQIANLKLADIRRAFLRYAGGIPC